MRVLLKSFIVNPDKFLAETIFSDGMKAKPGSPFRNRGTGQNSVSDVTRWESEKKKLFYPMESGSLIHALIK